MPNPNDPEERPAPASPDTEVWVLGACFHSKSAALRVADELTEEDFSLKRHKLVHRAICDLTRRRLTVDYESIYLRLETWGVVSAVKRAGEDDLTLADVGEISRSPEITNLEYMVQFLRNKTTLRRMLVLGHELVSRATESGADPSAIANYLGKEIYTNLRRVEPNPSLSLKEFIKTYRDRDGGINELFDPSQRDAGILTGFTQFDEVIGGIFEGEIVIIGAEPGSGKTAFGLQVARKLARRGQGVLILSMEMRKRSLFNRLACAIAEVSVNRFRRGELSSEEKMRIVEATELIESWPIIIDDNTALNPVQIRMKIERTMQEQDIALTIIDFLQLASSDSARHNENEKLTAICNGLQSIAHDSQLKSRIMLLSQLNRGTRRAKQEPTLESLRGSGTIEQVGNIIAFLHFDDDGKSEGRGRLRLIMAKNREGEKRKIPMRFLGWKGVFEEIEIDTERPLAADW